MTKSDFDIMSNSTYGGRWTETLGVVKFGSYEEALAYGCAYNDYHNSWRSTSAGSMRGAISAYNKNGWNVSLLASTDGPGKPFTGFSLDAIKLLWDLKIIGRDFPDNISFDLNLGTVFGIGESVTFSINILTRGDAGISLTRTEQLRGGEEVDWGLNINFGYYTGNPLNINESTLLGPVRSVSGGWFYGGNISAGYKDRNFGRPSWINFGTGIGLTAGGSYGWGKTYKG
jgi:hypothetical protein